MDQNRAGNPDHRESGIVQRVRRSLRSLPVEHPHVLMACSGGKDSVALAWVLAGLRRLDLLTLSIAHIHHGQHDKADAAVEAVLAIGRALDVRVIVSRLDPSHIAAHAGVGLEEAMRRERYLALAGIANELGADALTLAHHQSDQAETVLLHLLRGSGLNGMAGMREWEARGIPWWTETAPATTIGLWRPFISEPADEVAAIALASGLPVLEDPTNTDMAFRRNAIRHQLLPVIEALSPGSTAAVARAADLIAADADLLRDLTDHHLEACVTEGGLERDGIVQLPLALQRRVVRAWLEGEVPHGEFSLDRISAVLELAQRNRGGARVQIGGHHSVVLRGGYLKLDPWQNRDR